MQEILNNLGSKYPEFWRDSNVNAKIRRRTLEFLFVAYCVLGLLLAAQHFAFHREWLFWKALCYTCLSYGGYQMLRRGMATRIVGHFAMICLSVVIMSTPLFYQKGHFLLTFQFIFLVVSSSFYILGAKWGLFYSLINAFLVLIIMAVTVYLKIKIDVTTYSIDSYTLSFTLLYNFMMLLYVHYFFFKESELANAKESALLTELKISVAQAQDLAAYKTNFLTTMSHEIRTPLHAIMGGVDLLIAENPKSDQEKSLTTVKFSADVLNSIINDILNLNDLENNQITLTNQVFQPALLVADLGRQAETTAGKKGIKLSTSISTELNDVWVSGDSVRLAQILMNLLGNAIKYTEQGSIAIKAESRNHGHDANIYFEVSDTGIGIPAEVFPYIFQPFKMVESHTKKQYHGTGLGLSLANRLVELHGGKLEFTSQEGVGTTFYFQISYPVTSAPHNPMTPADDLPLSQLKVLVAEDNRMNATILKNFLKKWGVQFDIVENGLEAVQSVYDRNYDVILMDINMPMMDGIEATKKIRGMNDPQKSGIPVIALTAASRDSIDNESIALFDDWMSKPFHPQVLHKMLLGCLSDSSSQ